MSVGAARQTNRWRTTRHPIFLFMAIALFAVSVYIIAITIKSMPPSEKQAAEEDVRGNLGVESWLNSHEGKGILGKHEGEEFRNDEDDFEDDESGTLPLQPVGRLISQLERDARASGLSVYTVGALPKTRDSRPMATLGTQVSKSSAVSQRHSDQPDPNGQSAKRAFLANQKNHFISTARVHDAPGDRLFLSVGTIIPALMKEAINSDLPGEIRAQVSLHVYDSPSGEKLLIPRGSTLFGSYDSQVSYGQRRVLVVWHLLVYPDGKSLNLQAMAGSDAAGVAGFHDQVNNHYLRIFGSAILLSVISAGAQISQPQNSVLRNQSVGSTAAAALGQNLTAVGTNLTQRNLNVQPTLEIRPGYRFVVKVNKQLRFASSYVE